MMNFSNPSLSLVCIALLNQDRSILMQLRDLKKSIYCPGYWSLPGGGMKPAESPEEAIKREVLEETGYHLSKPQQFSMALYRNEEFLLVSRTAFVEQYDEEQDIACYEGQKMEFVTFEYICRQRVVPGHLKLISRILQV